MAYIINKTNGDQLTSVPDGEIDISTSIRLVGKNYPGYGEIIAENLVGMLENFANAAAPRNPMNGQLWYDTSGTPVMKCYSSALAAWQTLATVSGSGGGGGGGSYALPTASATVLGGVKIGAGITITNGVISASGGGASGNLDGLTDVTIATPTNGQVLKYNSTTGQWYNGTDSSGTTTITQNTITRVDTLEANYASLNSAITSKASITYVDTVVANEAGARATAITNLTALFNSLASGSGATVEYVNTAIASAGFASASSVTTLSTTVSGITSQLVNYSSLESTVNGVTGKWGVKINANGAISGVEMLNGTGGTSFTVAADQFKITGDTPANGKSIFTVDTNSKEVTINGNLIVNGSITENKIGTGAVTTTGIYSGAVSGGYNTTSASGDSLSLTISVPAGCNKFTILANPGKSVVEYLISADSGFGRQYWTASLSVDSAVATTQTGTMVWTVANPSEGNHTINLYRSPDIQTGQGGGAGPMVLDVTIYKR